MKAMLFSFLLLLACFVSIAQTNLVLKWQKSYGGTYDDYAYDIQPTTDGGFIMAGSTSSIDGDVTGNHGGSDFWVVKTEASGLIQWQKCYGGSGEETARCIKQTGDGGYIIAGTTTSNDGDVTFNHGMGDAWVVKTDPAGNIQWQRCYGGTAWDEAYCVQQTGDGGYIIAGYTFSTNGDLTGAGNHGGGDFMLIKIDQSGAILWKKCYGGSDDDEAYKVLLTSDGGYIVTGESKSNNGDVTVNHGGHDFWIVKTDASGTIQWQKSYGGSDEDIPQSILETLDGGYIITGETGSTDGDITNNKGSQDLWIVKTNASGVLQWQRTYGGTMYDGAYGIVQMSDGSYLVAGYTYSQDGDVSGNHGDGDLWVIKTNVAGGIQWQHCFGGTWFDGATSLQKMNDGAFIVTGLSESQDGDVTGNHGGFDFWTANLCNSSPLSISISDTDYCYSTNLTATGGFEHYLWNNGDTTRTIEVTAGGIYSVTGTNASGCPSTNNIVVPDPLEPYNNQQICMVTMDSLSGKNVILIENVMNVGTDSIRIYRMDNFTSVYKVIGTIGINDPGLFTDINAIPAQQSYLYRVSVKDTCGKESALTTMHRTIFLQANSGGNNEVNLWWNPYEGSDYPNFQIYRSNTGGVFQLIATVPNVIYAYSDLNSPAGIQYYQVRISLDPPCLPGRPGYSQVYSNVVKHGVNGINENQANTFSLYPNPATDKITIETSGEPKESSLVIVNSAGQELITRQLSERKTVIDISSFPSGVYFVRVTNNKSVEVGKIVKQ
jgi:hypothetical protein